MSYLTAFLTGGIICVIGQVLIDKTKLTSARILVLFVTLGVILTGLGLYEPIVKTDTYNGYRVVNDFNEFKASCDIIIANRDDRLLEDVKDKLYTRDIYKRDC